MGEKTIEEQTEQALISGYERFYRLAYSYVQNREDALDVVQESACKAIRDCDRLKDPSKLPSWLCRIVVNTALDTLRKRKLEFPSDSLPDRLHEDTYEETDLGAAIRALDDKSRTVIFLRYFEDMKFDDIAAVVDENINTVKARLYRSLRRLKVTMDPETAAAGQKTVIRKENLHGR